ncbi:MAG: hypothetical protein R3A78_08840 [Polyangiales bacterium]|nr:hypothetical protein [Myxococcales bacterium]
MTIGCVLALAAGGCTFQAKGEARVGDGESSETSGGEKTTEGTGDSMGAHTVDGSNGQTRVDHAKDEPLAGSNTGNGSGSSTSGSSTSSSTTSGSGTSGSGTSTSGTGTTTGSGTSGSGTTGSGTSTGGTAAGGTDTEQPAVIEVADKPLRGETAGPKEYTKAQSEGQPTDLSPKKKTAVWVWYDTADGYWKVRTSAKEGSKLFRGRIGIAGPKAKFVDVKGAGQNKDDRFLVKKNAVHFAFRTSGGQDGIDAKTENSKCMFFRFLVDDQPATEVYLGKENLKVDTARFRVCDDAKSNATDIKKSHTSI